MNNRKRTALCLLGAALCVFMAFGAALALGRYPITPAALLAGDAMAVRTFTVLRLPRAVMALIGGFGLGAAGFVYQTVFRNPLASPDIIGVSSGASVGAAFAILFVSSGALSTTVCAFAGGLAAVFLSLGLAAAAPGRSKMSLVLAGIAVHALAQTLLMLLKLTADPEKELASIEYWIMGSLAAVTRSRVWFPVPVVLVCCAAIFALHRQALLLSIEEGEARLLGVRVGAMRLLLLTLATMTVAAVVSVTGLISFVGLLAPHSARLLAGHNRRSACLLSGLLGSALLEAVLLRGGLLAALIGIACGADARAVPAARRPAASRPTSAAAGRRVGGGAPAAAASGLPDRLCDLGGHAAYHHISERTGETDAQIVSGDGWVEANAGHDGVRLFRHLYNGHNQNHPGKHVEAAGDGGENRQEHFEKYHVERHQDAHGAEHPAPAGENFRGVSASAHGKSQRSRNGQHGEDHIALRDF